MVKRTLIYTCARVLPDHPVLFDLKATPAPVSRMEFQEKRFIRRVLSRLARRLERFVGGQLINKSWKEGSVRGRTYTEANRSIRRWLGERRESGIGEKGEGG